MKEIAEGGIATCNSNTFVMSKPLCFDSYWNKVILKNGCILVVLLQAPVSDWPSITADCYMCAIMSAEIGPSYQVPHGNQYIM